MTKSERNKQYYEKNREVLRAKQREYHREYYKNPDVKLRKKLYVAGLLPVLAGTASNPKRRSPSNSSSYVQKVRITPVASLMGGGR